MKSRSLLKLWRGQDAKCFFCDGETFYLGFRLVNGQLVSCRGTPTTHPAHATLSLLARKCDGGDRRFENLIMSCWFCHTAREHPFAIDHALEMERLIEFGCHPCHRNFEIEEMAA